MNYQHAFHAGNFADVVKHVVLVALIDALTKKPKPLAYIETHAGEGRYRLDERAAETGEFRVGIGRLYDAVFKSELLSRFRNLVIAANDGAALRCYPGSPALAAATLRASDRLVLVEKSPAVRARLASGLAGDARIHIREGDGYGLLKSLLPPIERRALVLIDPPYETRLAEFDAVRDALDVASKRFPTGVYAVWYPIKRRVDLNPFYRWLSASGWPHLLRLELMVYPDDSQLRLNGCGIVVLNAPWQIDVGLRAAFAELTPLLARDPRAAHRIDWLSRDTA